MNTTTMHDYADMIRRINELETENSSLREQLTSAKLTIGFLGKELERAVAAETQAKDAALRADTARMEAAQ